MIKPEDRLVLIENRNFILDECKNVHLTHVNVVNGNVTMTSEPNGYLLDEVLSLVVNSYYLVKTPKWIDVVCAGESVCTFRRELFPDAETEATNMIKRLNGES